MSQLIRNSDFKSKLNSNSGFSLVEVLVALSLMMVAGLAMTTMMHNQMKEIKAMQEKMATVELGTNIVKTLTSSSICRFLMSDPSQSSVSSTPNRSADTIDATNATTLAASTITFQRLPAAASITAIPVAKVGDAASANTPNFKVTSMKFKNFTSNGIDQYLADLEVNFTQPPLAVRSLKPFVLEKVNFTTLGVAPINAKSFTDCSAPRGPGPQLRRYSFYYTGSVQTFTVPAGVTSAFVSMAGGGATGLGWRITNALITGSSGGYVVSYPLTLIPGDTLSITVGQAGAAFPTVNTGTAATLGPPYFIYTYPAGDDGLGGHPGTLSKIESPILGSLIECSGGSGATTAGIDAYSGGMVPGPLTGAVFGSGTPPYSAPNREALDSIYHGAWGTPGHCGAYGGVITGFGSPGISYWATAATGILGSGSWLGGSTPLKYGSGGGITITGCYITSTVVGTCVNPGAAQNGVVHLDVLY